MVVSDPIADMLIRIKNGYLAKKKLVVLPTSKIKVKLAQILVDQGFLKKAEVVKDEKIRKGFQQLRLELKYKGNTPAFTNVKRISKPGVRLYAKADKIPFVRQGVGITIISSSKGLITNQQAKKDNLGGEIICQIW